MRFRLLLGVGIALAAGAGCTEQQVTAPDLSPQFGEITPPPCDPNKGPCEEPGIGRMTGGGGQITVGGVFVSRGLTLHCDITLSNNLEVNWDGNKWHLDKPIETADCIDNPDIHPEPPPAPFDTFVGTATGRLNGVDGSRIEFTFIDAGEPGGKNDQAAITIYDPSGAVVLNVPLSFVDKGNLQAHYDQPHGSNVNR